MFPLLDEVVKERTADRYECCLNTFLRASLPP